MPTRDVIGLQINLQIVNVEEVIYKHPSNCSSLITRKEERKGHFYVGVRYVSVICR